jgi:signal transduction histidine kinase
MRNAHLAAVDREIDNQAERELSRRWSPDHWPQHERNMARAFGADDPGQILLLVQDRHALVYRSAHWPLGLDPGRLPWPPTSGDPGPDPPSPDIRPRAHLPALVTRLLVVDGRQWRLGLAATPDDRLAIGVDLALVEAGMADLRAAFLLATPLALLCIGLGAWFLSGRTLAPIRRLTTTMAGLTAQGLDQRLPLGHEDREFHQLIAVFNGMLERLERSFQQASRFSGDAAHELKTPLAILQGQIEQAMAQAESGSPIQICLGAILDEVQHLGAILRKLLVLSLADAGRLRLSLTTFDLSQALEELLEDSRMIAPDLEIRSAIAPGLTVAADVELLRQVLNNLLGNAIKYNLPHGWIRVDAARRNERIEVSIANASDGIAVTDREHLFERFYRADSARHRRIDGVGLGLSLAREIARAHGGDVVLAENREGAVWMRLSLPA